MKYLLTILSFFVLSHVSAQNVEYAWNYHENAGNPGGLNDSPSDYSNGLPGSFTISLQGPIFNNRWTPVIPLPFPFAFYGDTTVNVRASTNGLLTLDTLDTALISVNTNLPESGIPDHCISAFWHNFAQQDGNAHITHRTYGTAPNRQFWIKWNDFKIGATDPVFMAIVLEESTHKIYVVDMFTESPGHFGTVGIQNMTEYLQPTGSPVQMQGNAFQELDNDYYEFFMLDSLNASVEAFTSLDNALCEGLHPLNISVRNLGYTPIDSLVIGYGWNGPGTFDTIGGLNIEPNETDTLTLDSLFFLAGSAYDFEFYLENVNGIPDEDQQDDTLRIDAVQTGLMGNYTVDPSSPTAGTNYQSLSEVAFALNHWGLCGAVQFQLEPETYVDNLYLTEVKGSSATNSILFKGDPMDSTVLTHDGIGKRNNVRLYGTDHITFEDLHFVTHGILQHSAGILINDGADSVTISNCSFILDIYSKGPMTTGNTRGGVRISRDSVNAVPSSSAPIGNHISIEHCRFTGFARAIEVLGDYGGAKVNFLSINHNEFIDNTLRTIEIRRGYEFSILDNYIMNNKLYGWGIDIYASYNFRLSRNQVYSAQRAARISNTVGNTSYPRHIISNNIFSSRIESALMIEDIHDARLINNTMKGKLGATIESEMDEISILNNIFHGRSQALYIDYYLFNSDTLDHNIYHSDSSTLIRFDNTYYNDLNSFQNAFSGVDQNSFEAEPLYRRNNDLHRFDTVANNSAFPGIVVSQDIDQEARSVGSYDIGADEFEATPVDLDLISILSPRGYLCEDSAQLIEVAIRNNGVDTVQSIPYLIAFSGSPSTFAIYDTLLVNLSPFDQDTVELMSINTLNIDSGLLTIELQVPNDDYPQNDVLTSKLNINHDQVGQPQLTGDTICAPDSIATWTATALNGTAHWYLNTQSDSAIEVGNQLEEAIYNTTTRSVGFTNNPDFSVGHVVQPGDSMGVPGGAFNLFLVFRAFQSFTLDSVTVYPGDTGWVKLADIQFDYYSGEVDTHEVVYRYVEPDSAFAPVRIPVDITFIEGDHGLATFGSLASTNGLLRTYQNVDYPYVIPNVVSIDGSFSGTIYYYYWFYDWKISVNGCVDTNRYEVTANYEDSDLTLPMDDQFCQEDSLTIVPTTTGGTFNSFLWHDGSAANQYTANLPEEISVIGTSTLGCSRSDTMLVDTFPSPPTMVPNDTTICDTDQLALPTVGGTFTTTWTFGGNTVSQAQAPGQYNQSVEDINGCFAEDFFLLDTLDCDTMDSTTSIPAVLNPANYRIYPNPTSDVVTIQFDGASNHRSYRIYSAVGHLVHEKQRGVKTITSVNLNGLAKGIYFIELEMDDQFARERLILN